MRPSRPSIRLLATLAILASCGAPGRAPSESTTPGLAGTAWRLLKLQAGDGTVARADEGATYTLELHADGSLTARVDCNRGRGTWSSTGPGHLRLGLLALTRAMCPPGSLHDRVLKDWSLVRSYVVREGRLYLSPTADGGMQEFGPTSGGG